MPIPFKLCWENWTDTYKRMKLDPYLTPYTNVKSKWIKDFKVKPETIKVLEENIRISSLTSVLAMNNFSDLTPKAQATKTKIKKWNYIKLKCFFTIKEAINKMERQPMG